MRYIIKNLLPGENIVYKTKKHWVVFVDSVLGLLFFTALVIVSYSDPNMPLPMGILGFMITLFRFLYVLIEYIASNYVVTDRRVIIKEGFFRIYSEESQLNKIDGIHIEQNFIQRILNYGSITIETAGSLGKTYRNINRPLDFRINVNTQIVLTTP